MSNSKDTMHFHGLPERLLGSRSKIAVLSALLNSPGAEWTGREIARKAGVSPTQAMSALRAFEAEGVCRQRGIGGSSVWSLVRDHFLTKALEPLATLDQTAQNRLQKEIEGALDGSGAMEAYLFGSIAKGSEEASSDIDLLVVFPDRKHLEAWQGKLDRLRTTVQEEFASFLSPTLLERSKLKRQRASRLLREARRGGRVIEVGP